MKISVTKQHIDAGIKLDACSCPLALALSDAGFPKPVVDGEQVEIAGEFGLFPLPEVAQQFVSDFDHGLPVAPFDFELGDWVVC